MKIQIGEWTLEERANLITRGDETIRLEKRVIAVLMQLIEADGEVVSKEALIEAVWKGAAVSDHSVANAISDLRRALGDDRREPRYIETIPKRGYRLLAPVKNAALEAETVSEKASNHSWRAYAAALFLLVAVSSFWLFMKTPEPARLYFADIVNASGDSEFDIDSKTASEMLTAALAGGDYRLVRWRGEADGIPIAMRLRKKDRVIHGRIINDSGDYMLALSMIDPSDGASVWASAYPVNETNYSTLASAIVADLQLPLGLDSTTASYDYPDPALAEAYWKARYLWSLRTHPAIREALSILTDITQRAPDFAAAHAAIADIYAHKTAEELGLDRPETYALAERHLAQAELLCPNLSEAFITRAYLSFFKDNNVSAAMADIRKAIDARPDNALAWQTKAMIASASGDAQTSLDAIKRASNLDPLSASILWDDVWFLYIAKRYDAALEKAFEARSVSPPVLTYEALIHLARGDDNSALESWLAKAMTGGMNHERVAQLRAIASKEGARAALNALADEALAGGGFRESALPLSSLLNALDRRDEAVVVLINSPAAEKSWWWSWYAVMPGIDGLRHDPRLASIGTSTAG